MLLWSARIALLCSLIVISVLSMIPLDYPVVAEVNDKLQHLVAFFVLAMLADFSFPRQRVSLLIILTLTCYGLAIEVIQSFIPHRYFSLWDWLADMVGIASYYAFRPVVHRLVRRWIDGSA